jgi:RHS repeat-associated protein
LKHKGYNDAISGNVNSVASKFGFGGKENNQDLGLEWMEFGARNYDASIGRWMNIDPLAEQAYDWTSYRYSFNNPVNLIDPDGLFEFRWNEGKDGSFSLSIVKSNDDDAPEQNIETFMKETGLSNKEVNILFGENKMIILSNRYI